MEMLTILFAIAAIIGVGLVIWMKYTESGKKWVQLIDTIEKDPFETEAFFALMEYVGEASDDEASSRRASPHEARANRPANPAPYH